MGSPINALINKFAGENVLESFQAAEELIQLGKKAYPALLEAALYQDKRIARFSQCSLVWAKDPKVISLVLKRIRTGAELGEPVYPLYWVLLGYGEESIPQILRNLELDDSKGSLLFLLWELLNVPFLEGTENLELALEFEEFLRLLHSSLSLARGKIRTEVWQKLKNWWLEKESGLPEGLDRKAIEKLLISQGYSHPSSSEIWQFWWKKNWNCIRNFLQDAHAESIQREKNRLTEEMWPPSPFMGIPLLAADRKDRLRDLRKHWMKLWEVRRSEKKRPSEILEQAFLHLRLGHLLEAVEELNRLCLDLLFSPKRRLNSKKCKSLLEGIQNLIYHKSSTQDETFQRFLFLLQSLVYELERKFQKALVHLCECSSLPSSDQTAVLYYYHFFLGRLLLRKKQFPKAVEHLLEGLHLGEKLLRRRKELEEREETLPLTNLWLPSVGRDAAGLFRLSYQGLYKWKKQRKRKT